MNNKKSFNDRIHRLGMTTSLMIWVFFLAVPLGITLYFKIDVSVVEILTVATPIAITFGVIGLAEKMSIVPTIGPGAMYLASSTGNVQNMKLPAALNAMNLMGCEEGSEKSRAISIIAVATSAIVTTIIVFCGMLFLGPVLEPLLTNPYVQPAFDNLLPALLGPLVFPIVLKNPKTSILPFLIAIIFVFVLGSKYTTLQSLVLVVNIVTCIVVYKIIYDRKSK